MAFKFIAFAALLAAAQAGVISSPYASAPVAYAAAPAYPTYTKVAAPVAYAAPIAKVAAPVAVAKTVVAEEYDPHPQYSYGYDVQDGLTGDSKTQHEQRDGDVVQGAYSVVDPDGTKRTVEYTADPVHGFNAVVHKEPLVHKAVVAAPAVAKIAAPVAYAAPIAKYAAAPVAYAAAPQAHYYHH